MFIDYGTHGREHIFYFCTFVPLSFVVLFGRLFICCPQELEKIAPKEKGIIMQSVKEVVQSLVDDSLVDTDKIGTSVYFWSYPR